MHAISVALPPELKGAIEFFLFLCHQLDNIIQNYKHSKISTVNELELTSSLKIVSQMGGSSGYQKEKNIIVTTLQRLGNHLEYHSNLITTLWKLPTEP